jgi:hypothetical protein
LFGKERNERLFYKVQEMRHLFNKLLIDYVEELVAIVLQPDCCGGMPEKW